MAIDCLHEPSLLAFGKSFGASLGIFGAALAWLVNNAIQWTVWFVGQRRRQYELIKALKAEIASNGESEAFWAEAAAGEGLIASLRANPSETGVIPYVAVVEGNQVFDALKDSISQLPAPAIEKLVAYYNQTRGLTAQLSDFRSEAFAKLNPDRQVRVIREVFELGRRVLDAAAEADQALSIVLTSLRVQYGLAVATALIALTVGAPCAIGAAKSFLAAAVTPAVEWASACDLPSKKAP